MISEAHNYSDDDSLNEDCRKNLWNHRMSESEINIFFVSIFRILKQITLICTDIYQFLWEFFINIQWGKIETYSQKKSDCRVI